MMKRCKQEGQIQDFHLRGGGGGVGGRKGLWARAHITSAKPEVPIDKFSFKNVGVRHTWGGGGLPRT